MAMLNNQMVCVSFRVFSQGQHSRRPEGLDPAEFAVWAGQTQQTQFQKNSCRCWPMFAHEFFLEIPKFSQDCSLNKNVSKHGDYHSITDLSDFVLEGDCTTNSSPFLVSVRGSSRALCRRLALWVDTGDLPTKWTLPQPKLSCESTWAKTHSWDFQCLRTCPQPFSIIRTRYWHVHRHFRILGMIFFCWVNLFWDFWYIDEPTHIDTLWLQCKAAFAMSCLPSRFGLPDGFQISVGILQSLQFWWFVRCIKPDT